MSDTSIDLGALLEDASERVRNELASTPEVVDVGQDLDVSALPIVARRWHKATDVVSVVVDLKNSTRLGTGKWAASTASIYEAATGNVANLFDHFSANFMQIQGDGVVAIFWGEGRYERAICAGITVKTFSDDLVKRLESKWDDLVGVTGYKVGIASGRALVKNVGVPRNPANQEPIWAGKPVNYASKAAQSADRHELIVTGRVWDKFERNDYIALSCGCKGEPSDTLWKNVIIDRLPDSDPDRSGRLLVANWCVNCGPGFCNAILAGKKQRPEAANARVRLDRALFKDAIFDKARQERRDRRARGAGLA